jgi:hypothetical protein
MHEDHHGHSHAPSVDGQHVLPESAPYWKRAHHDWRFWVGLVLMLVAISVYFMSDDLSLIPSSQPPQGAARK